jgi:hypothetical protein
VLVTVASLSAGGALAVIGAGVAAGAAGAALLWGAVTRTGDGPGDRGAPISPVPPRERPPAPPLPPLAGLPEGAGAGGTPTASTGTDVEAPEHELTAAGAPAGPVPGAEAPRAAPPLRGDHMHHYNTEYSAQLHRLDQLRVRIATHLASGHPSRANGHTTPPPDPPPEPPPDDRR